jgi:hypothetical protein
MQRQAPYTSTEPSAELMQAQAQLLKLRAQLGITVQAAPRPDSLAAPRAEAVNWPLLNAQAELYRRRGQGERQSTPAIPLGETAAKKQWPPEASQLDAEPTNTTISACTIVVHPTLVLALLREKLEAPGRVYFLLRHIDSQGRGWLRIKDIRHHLTHKDSPLRICGWRRLRQLLHEGHDIFWQRDNQDRLWLRGAHKIAYTLDSGRLQGFPIELPIRELLGGIQATRAAFYASFHGGRDVKPISRQTLNQITGITERTQRTYDRVARVTRHQNIAIGERFTREKAQQRAWTQGRGVFQFVDTKGLQGRENQEYIAWHLPNSYQANYQRRSRGSRKRLNRKLADLLKKGITGNSEEAIKKVFFPSGALAARAYNRDPNQDAYWQHNKTRLGDQVWRTIPRWVKK